ncbi:MAG: glutamine synthetase, partial [Rhizobiales bacterium]|nr:glutamine synthetase [Hyphomicrobiales bacterium]
SEMMKNAVAGMLEAMPDQTLIFAPHANSYRRLRKGSYAPTFAAWGYENRTTAIRIPGGSSNARRIEHRVAGGDSNPYLVLAAILSAALEGIENKLQPTPPIVGEAYLKDLPPLAASWADAVEKFEESALIARQLSPLLQGQMVECKRQEMEVFAQKVTDFEYESYLATL